MMQAESHKYNSNYNVKCIYLNFNLVKKHERFFVIGIPQNTFTN